MRRRAGRLRRYRPYRPVPDVHVAAVVGRRQAAVQLRVRAGPDNVRVHVRPAVGHGRLCRGDVNFHVLRTRLLVHARRPDRPAVGVRQPEELVRHRHRHAGRALEQSERGPGVCRHVRQSRTEVSDGVSVRAHLRSLHIVHIVLIFS